MKNDKTRDAKERSRMYLDDSLARSRSGVETRCADFERRSRASWLKRDGGGVRLEYFPFFGPQWRSVLSFPLFSSSSHLKQVLNPRAALLSNYEVLQLLRELEADHIARTRIAQRLKKEEEDAPAVTAHPVSENLRTIEVEVRLVSSYQRKIHF